MSSAELLHLLFSEQIVLNKDVVQLAPDLNMLIPVVFRELGNRQYILQKTSKPIDLWILKNTGLVFSFFNTISRVCVEELGKHEHCKDTLSTEVFIKLPECMRACPLHRDPLRQECSMVLTICYLTAS